MESYLYKNFFHRKYISLEIYLTILLDYSIQFRTNTFLTKYIFKLIIFLQNFKVNMVTKQYLRMV